MCHFPAKFVNRRNWTSLACSSVILGAEDQGEKCAGKANPWVVLGAFDPIRSLFGAHG